MNNLKGIFVIILMIIAVAMCAQPTFEILPVSGDTTFQVKTTVRNTDNSETITLTEPYDSVRVRDFIDIQIARNSRVTARKVNELKNLNTEAVRLKLLFNRWNPTNYFSTTQDKYIKLFRGTWRLWYDGKGTLLTINDKRRANEFGGNLSGVLIIESKDVIVLKDYLNEKVEVKFYKEKEDIFVGEYLDKKIFLRKISNEIKKEEDKRK